MPLETSICRRTGRSVVICETDGQYSAIIYPAIGIGSQTPLAESPPIPTLDALREWVASTRFVWDLRTYS